ncbi:hypothetical protein RHMOL_Rhmol03G0195500 [Rhododendron molle]|uniref:Uncharacterized protein n=1 Tax=Rhododendron molle TaxID=49168 RepID=A0ACC0PHL5_RHOML|nr:hypothetical protein RHMOL_Rhmol03G0195500 [Rhododendron molle]
MAILVQPRFHYLTHTSPNPTYRPPTRPHRSSVAVASMPSKRARMESSAGRDTGAAVLWFKHDLRLDDHPGLAAASSCRTVVPLYVFDRRILSRFSDETLEVLLLALEDLRKSLKDQGSDLVIRLGTAEHVLQELVKEVKATKIFAEEEVEYDLRRMLDVVGKTLSTMSIPEGNPRFVLWNAPLYDIKNLKDLPAFYDEFEKLKFTAISPLLPPKLPNLKVELTWGSVPTLEDLKKFMNDCLGKSKDHWTSIKGISAESLFRSNKFVASRNQIQGLALSKTGDSNQSNSYNRSRNKRNESVFVTQRGNVVGGGTTVVLNALAAYLRYLEGTVRDDWQEVHEKLRIAESREGASFGTLFGPALRLGIISRRRAHYEAIKYEKERNGGFLSPFGYSAATVAAVADTVCSMEWYWLMASKSQFVDKGRYAIRIWRWKGFLIQYTVAGHEGPAILLVHGFGAFLEHFRDNINRIAEGGNRVWAITLLGFGRSEKPNVVYTEVMWAELLKDFIIEVVGEPVHLVGNSMGGYFVAIVAGLWPAVAKSIVLINSAGNVVPQYSSVPLSKERQTSAAAWLGARLLLFYLRLSIKNLMTNLYPTQVERADDWVINEMVRAGRKDPLYNSQTILALLREHCKGVTIRELDAGHCPHDEQPEAVNSIIQEWVVTVGARVLSGGRT